MWGFITRPLDRCAMRSACGSVRPSPDGDCRVEAALAMLRRPDFFAPDVPLPQIEELPRDTFRFRSPVESSAPENNIVPGRMFRVEGDWQRRPTVILLHGWNAELQYAWMFPFWGQLLARAGVNALTFELPYHSSRRPRDPNAIRNFLSGDLSHVMHATHQALADTRALAQWLYENGAPSVGLWGVSLGAWLAGLAMAHQAEFNTGVLLTPVSRMDRALRELPFCEPIRDQLVRYDHEFAPLNLITHPPPSDPRRMLVVGSTHDLFAPADTIDELERAWHPEVWRVPHGHITVLIATRIIRRIVKWLAASMQSPLLTQPNPPPKVAA
jgi:dienelactone hydrolase